MAVLAAEVAERGNPNLRGDAAAGAVLGEAGARIGANLVEINLGAAEGDERVAEARKLVAAAAAASRRVLARLPKNSFQNDASSLGRDGCVRCKDEGAQISADIWATEDRSSVRAAGFQGKGADRRASETGADLPFSTLLRFNEAHVTRRAVRCRRRCALSGGRSARPGASSSNGSRTTSSRSARRPTGSPRRMRRTSSRRSSPERTSTSTGFGATRRSGPGSAS